MIIFHVIKLTQYDVVCVLHCRGRTKVCCWGRGTWQEFALTTGFLTATVYTGLFCSLFIDTSLMTWMMEICMTQDSNVEIAIILAGPAHMFEWPKAQVLVFLGLKRRAVAESGSGPVTHHY